MGEVTELPAVIAKGVNSTLIAFDDVALSGSAPVALMMPAMGVRASFYAGLAGPLADRGLRLVTCDLRGHGRSSVRASRTVDYGFREMLEEDWPAAIRVVKAQYRDAPVMLLGHSLGGKLSLLFAAANPGVVGGVVSVASCSIYWAAFPLSMRLPLLCFSQIAAASAYLLGRYHGHRIGFAGNEARSMIADWARQSRTGRYRVRGSDADYEGLLAAMETPSLVISIAGDRFAPRSATDHLFAKLNPATATRLHLCDVQSNDSGNVHFDWVRRPEPVLDAVAQWLNDKRV